MFSPRPVHVSYAVDRVVTASACAVPVSIVPPMLHIHLHLQVNLTRRTKEGSIGMFQKQCSFGNWGALGIKLLFLRFSMVTYSVKLVSCVLITYTSDTVRHT